MSEPYVIIKRQHYTPSEVGRLIGRSRQTVIKWANEGLIEAWRTPGGHWRIPADAVKGASHGERIGA